MTRYISLFSGIECASLAAKPLGWEPICFSEIEPFPSAVLAHHYPDVPNVGDVTAHDWTQYRGRCDLVIGGSPCQAFSVAGRRESLADARGNLTLSFVEAVNAIDPTFVVWENVPGVLSTRDNAFGCFLAALAGHDDPIHTPDGRGWTAAGVVVGPRRHLAWRVLDAQYFGVPQRRRRIFLVGCTLASGFDPAEILFEREGLRGDYPEGREAGKDIAGSTAKCLTGSNQRIDYETETLVTAPLTARQYSDNAAQESRLVVHTLRSDGFDASEDGTGRGTPLVFDTTQVTSPGNYSSPKPGDPCHPLAAGAHPPAIAFHGSQDHDVSGDVTHPVGRNQGQEACVFAGGVRRLTPRECERLQGLPDDYTLIPWRGGMAPDGPRYKAIGNGMAVPCVRWIFERIEEAGK